jgi:hypothetical protein
MENNDNMQQKQNKSKQTNQFNSLLLQKQNNHEKNINSYRRYRYDGNPRNQRYGSVNKFKWCICPD